MEQVNKIKELRELIQKIDSIQSEKSTVVKEMRYEDAAALRDKEREFYDEIHKIANIDGSTFTSNTFHSNTTKLVLNDFYDVLRNIEEGDENLTLPLLRNLAKKIKESETNKRESLDRERMLKDELNKRRNWIKIHNKRPKLVEITNNDFCKRSEEVIVMHADKNGAHDVSIARYIEESNGVHDINFHFEKNNEEIIALNDVKGWQYLPGVDSNWRTID